MTGGRVKRDCGHTAVTRPVRSYWVGGKNCLRMCGSIGVEQVHKQMTQVVFRLIVHQKSQDKLTTNKSHAMLVSCLMGVGAMV